MNEANTPDNPPLLQEDDLSPAETKVLKAFRGGWESGERQVIVLPDYGGLPKNPRVEDLRAAILRAGDEATLRAHFLRGLFLGSYDNFAPRSVMISGAWIEGRLDLDYCEPCFPLGFSECFFSEGISLRSATISELGLVRCWIYQDQHGSSLSATQVQVVTNVSLNTQFVAYGEVDLNSANIGGQLDCTGGHFEKGMTAQNLKVSKDALLRAEFQSNGEVDIAGASIGGQLACDGGQFQRGLLAESLRTGNGVILSEGFKSKGVVDLVYANIGGNLNCDNGCFENGLRAQSLKTGKGVSLMKDFNSKGNVDLNGAYISGQLACAGGYFKAGLTAQNLNTGDSVFLTNGFVSNGVVDMIGANIGGQFACVGGYFEKGLRIQNIKTGGSVFLARGFRSSGEVSLDGADIGGVLDCTDSYFENGLIANGLRYQRIELGGDWKKGLSWLRQMRGDGFQPYGQLMTVYRRMGKPDWVLQIGFELEKKRHEQFNRLDSEPKEHWPLRKKRLIGIQAFALLVASPGLLLLYGRTFSFFEKSLWCIWYSLLRLAIGYGYKPFRFLGCASALLLAGTILFSDNTQRFSSKFTSSGEVPAFVANEWIPSEGEAHEYWRQNGQAPQGYPEFNPVIYSLEAAFPVLPLGQLDKWHSDNTLFEVVRWIWTFTGSVLLAIFALFGVGVLRPTWKSESDGG